MVFLHMKAEHALNILLPEESDPLPEVTKIRSLLNEAIVKSNQDAKECIVQARNTLLSMQPEGIKAMYDFGNNKTDAVAELSYQYHKAEEALEELYNAVKNIEDLERRQNIIRSLISKNFNLDEW